MAASVSQADAYRNADTRETTAHTSPAMARAAWVAGALERSDEPERGAAHTLGREMGDGGMRGGLGAADAEPGRDEAQAEEGEARRRRLRGRRRRSRRSRRR
jgi:hypothetical protein